MRLLVSIIVFAFLQPVIALQTATVRLEIRVAGQPLAHHDVTINGVARKTDAQGVVALTVSSGTTELEVSKEGFLLTKTSLQLQAGQDQTVVLELTPEPTVEEEITVAATRTDKRLEDLPMRVEVLEREEIEEKMLMTPGDIVMMLNEMGGMRVQATSPSLGAASVRIQGMRGRYTRFLSDGLPLFGDVGGLGLLQIPPMDLRQVEVIKGVASALYGAGAMGGVVNLVSRRPSKEWVQEVLVNRSTRGATDGIFFGAGPLLGRWGLSFLAGGHWQSLADVDEDGWADLPEYARAVVRPRLFWDSGTGHTLFATIGTTVEDRAGGTMPDNIPGTIGRPHREALDTVRADAGAVGQMVLRQRYLVTARAAANSQRHNHRFGDIAERDRHVTAFGEVTVRATVRNHTWVLGAALERDAYEIDGLPQFDYTFTVPGIFVQDDLVVAPWLSLSASARFDHHSEYGRFFSPRLSGLFRTGRWTARLSAGTGFFGPTFLTEETEAAGLSRLTVPRPLVAERGRSASVDVTRTAGPASMTMTLFASRVRNPVRTERSTAFTLTNATESTTNTGLELLGTFRRAPFALTSTYTFVNARESEEGRRVSAPLTPRHSAGLVAMIESEDSGRAGIEIYYTGRQRLDHNPHRDLSQPYVIVGFLAERRVGRVRVFLNAENVTGVRQTRWDPLLRQQRAVDGRWTVDAWAPLEGRVFNGGVRVGF